MACPSRNPLRSPKSIRRQYTDTITRLDILDIVGSLENPVELNGRGPFSGFDFPGQNINILVLNMSCLPFLASEDAYLRIQTHGFDVNVDQMVWCLALGSGLLLEIDCVHDADLLDSKPSR